MAKDMLNAIFEAEEESKKREADAKSQAEADVENAKIQANGFVEKAKAEGNSESERLFNTLRKQGVDELEQSRKIAENKCAEISKKAEKNRNKVIESVVEMLTS